MLITSLSLHRSRHMPFYIGAALGVVTLVVVALAGLPRAFEPGAIVFFLAYLILTFVKLPKLTAAFLRRHAADTDEPVAIIFAATLITVGVSIASLFFVLNGKGDIRGVDLALALLSVGLGWITVHVMAALHYAHVYWLSAKQGAAEGEQDSEIAGGLDFPGDDEPGVYEFLYFAFVIGMTAQTSDVQITKTSMRQLNLAHAIVSFFFNTVLVAATVNVAVSLSG